jgi:hypothetical protein
MWALVVFTVLGAMAAIAASQCSAIRRQLENRRNKYQAIWLARSGVELAAARLLAGADGYTGETVEPIPDSEVRITVEKDPARPDGYRITSEARYPVSGPGTYTHTLTRSATR